MEMLYSKKINKNFLKVLSLSLFIQLIQSQEVNYKIKIYSLCTPHYNIFKNNYFLPSLKDDFETRINYYDSSQKVDMYEEVPCNSVLIEKINLIIRAIKENWGKVFIFSDLDIYFFRSFKDLIPSFIKDVDIVVEKSHASQSPCSGFFICRGNGNTLSLWLEIKRKVIKENKLSDQSLLNRMLIEKNIFNVKWKFLPAQFFSAGLRFVDQGCPDKIIACNTYSISHIVNKIHCLDYFKNKYKQ